MGTALGNLNFPETGTRGLKRGGRRSLDIQEWRGDFPAAREPESREKLSRSWPVGGRGEGARAPGRTGGKYRGREVSLPSGGARREAASTKRNVCVKDQRVTQKCTSWHGVGRKGRKNL